MTQENGERKRLVIVSNRLPFVAAEENGTLRFHESTGGLVTGLSAYLDSLLAGPSGAQDPYVWVGWPGNTISSSLQDTLRSQALTKFRSCPVFLSEEDMEQFYHGFCNKTIWPLFHYFPSYAVYNERMWKHYGRVNEIFCDALLEVLKTEDVVWIHDYHLMLLPAMLRARRPEARVGFFLHIPFPSFEVFRLLPREWRRDLLSGLLGADLVGFHTYDYMQPFLQSVLRILGYENRMGQIALRDRVVKVGTFPMGIDFSKFSKAARLPEIRRRKDEFREQLKGERVIVSVDRLDYTKGILNRLEGFEVLLDRHLKYRGTVVLVMIVVPSRIGVEHYERMKREIEERVGEINGRFGTIGWTPVIYQYHHVSFSQLVALYGLGDVALVTPLRDGMNLVAKEYVAARNDGTGVLILSEMAGAAKELLEAVTVNPNNREEIASALKEALEMPVEEQEARNRVMRDRLRRYNVIRWADEFVDDLRAVGKLQGRLTERLMKDGDREQIVAGYRASGRRLALLDYDGTLVPFYLHPSLAKPRQETLDLLSRPSRDEHNTVVLVSGRDRETLEKWFGGIPVGLVAEHGIWIKEADQEWQQLGQFGNEWKLHIRPFLERYADRLPGAFIEEKEYSLAWHYRASDPEQSQLLVAELKDQLTNFVANMDVQVLQGSKVVEVRNARANKGAASLHWISKIACEFVLAAGDDWTDEDLFAALPESACSIRVGLAETRARYNVRDQDELLRLLRLLIG